MPGAGAKTLAKLKSNRRSRVFPHERVGLSLHSPGPALRDTRNYTATLGTGFIYNEEPPLRVWACCAPSEPGLEY